MGSTFHQLCPKYSGTLTPTAPTAIRLWDTFTLYLYLDEEKNHINPIKPPLALHFKKGRRGRGEWGGGGEEGGRES